MSGKVAGTGKASKPRQRRKKGPKTTEQRIDALLALGERRAMQNSSYTVEQAQACALMATALMQYEDWKSWVRAGRQEMPK